MIEDEKGRTANRLQGVLRCPNCNSVWVESLYSSYGDFPCKCIICGCTFRDVYNPLNMVSGRTKFWDGEVFPSSMMTEEGKRLFREKIEEEKRESESRSRSWLWRLVHRKYC